MAYRPDPTNEQTATTDEDDALLARAVTGDPEAFAQLIRSVDHKMRGLVYHLIGSAPATDDILQDAYLKAFRSLPGFRGESSFKNWVYRIVYTTCIDHLRRTGRRPAEHRQPFDEAALAATGGHDLAEKVAIRRDLQQALARLKPDQYAVVALVDGEGWSYGEVAELLDISPGTVASRLNRARASLRNLLTEPRPAVVR